MFKPVTILVCLLLPLLSFSKGNGNLQFISNKGQITDQYHQTRTDIDAKIEQGGVTLFVGSGQLHYQWVKNTDPSLTLPKGERTNNIPLSPLEGGNKLAREGEVIIYRMDVVLVGANKNAEVVFEEPTGYTEHYYKEYSPEEGIHAKGYKKVIYKEIWPGIDWVLYINSKSKKQKAKNDEGIIKYDFIVHSGADVNNIRLRYNGATELAIKDGALLATTPFGSIREAAPYSYILGEGRNIPSQYKLEGNTLKFDVEEQEGTVVIDPQLEWSTYYGGTGLEREEELTVCSDDSGNVFLHGETNSSTNIATTGAHKTTQTGSTDGFLVKFNRAGVRQWGTYYGGTGGEIASSIATDGANLYCTGVANSSNGIATSGSFQPTYAGQGDVYLIKFNNAGVRQWGTYYGTANTQQPGAVACDNAGNIWISLRNIDSSSYYLTGNAFISNGYNGINAIARFSPAGARQYGSYNYTHSLTFAFDDKGNYYIVGLIDSIEAIKNGVTTNGAHQTAFGGGVEDYYISKFDSSHNRLWATLYGGENGGANLISSAVDRGGYLYVSGFTTDTSGIATAGSYQPTRPSVSAGLPISGILAMFSPGGQLEWGTYYNASCAGGSITIDPAGYIYTLFNASGGSNYTTANAHKIASSSADALLVKWDPYGHRRYASFYGGNSLEYALSIDLIASNKYGEVFTIGETISTTGLATTGAHQTSYGGNVDAMLAKWLPDTNVYIRHPYVDTLLCPGDSLHLKYDVYYKFNNNNNFTVQLSDSNGDFSNAINIGSISSDTADTVACYIPLSVQPGYGYRLRIIGSSPIDTSIDVRKNIRIKENPQNFSASSNSPACTNDTLKLLGVSTSSGVSWSWSGPNSFTSSSEDTIITPAQHGDTGSYILTATVNSTGCSLSDTTTVTMKDSPEKPTTSSNNPICETLALNLSASTNTSGVSWSWTGPGNFSSTSQNPTVTTNASSSNSGSYIVAAIKNGCSSKDTINITVLPKPAKPTAGATNSPLCQFQDLQLTASNITGASYNWYGPSLFTANTQNPTRYSMTFTDSGYYYVYATINGCDSDTDSVRVVVNTDPVVNIFPSPGSTICKGEEATFTAVPTNAGTATYGWSVNHISTGTTGTTFKTSTLNNGDVVRCEMISTGTCATAYTDTSNGITMTVNDVKAPSVTISANPNTSLYPNEPVTFTASPTNGGNNPTYQWLRNGNPITGAQSAVWGANANFLNNGDDICVVLFSDHVCPEPDTALSNCIMVDIRLSVEAIAGNSNITIYPNPATNELHIEGIDNGTVIELYDVVGKKIHHATTSNNKYSINMSSYAAGNYLLKMKFNDGRETQSKIVKQ